MPRVKFAGSYLATRIVQVPQLKCVSGYLFASTRHSGLSDSPTALCCLVAGACVSWGTHRGCQAERVVVG